MNAGACLQKWNDFRIHLGKLNRFAGRMNLNESFRLSKAEFKSDYEAIVEELDKCREAIAAARREAK